MRCPLPPGSKVWTYTRESGGDDQTVDDQNRAVEQYCRDNNLVIERMFCDEARPGKSVAGRDQFQAMIRLSRSISSELLPKGLVIWRFSRFARDYDDSQFYKADLRRRGLVIVSIADDIPANGRHARLIEAVVDWHNDLFLDDLREDVKRGLHDIARQGYAPGGFPPVGYKAEKVRIGTKRSGEPRIVSRWIRDPEKASQVKTAWEMRAQGASYKEIHEATRILGATNSYASMFRNKTYLGIRKCGKLEIEDSHEPLITWEIWEAVQKTLRKRNSALPKGRYPSRSIGSPFLLSGLAKCLYCGSAVSGATANRYTRPNPWPYYLCGRKKRQGYDSCKGRMINARSAEKAVLQAVLSRVLTPTFLEELIEEVNVYLTQDLVDLELRIEELHKKLADTERAIGNLLDLAETFGARAAAARLLEREAEREQLQREVMALEIRREQSHIEVSPSVVMDVIARAREGLTGEDLRVKQTLLRKFVDKVEMGNEEGTVWYTFPLAEMIPDLTLLYLVPPKGFEPLSRA
jgi:site-specific DNA recombinase